MNTESRKKMLERVKNILARTMFNGCTEAEAMTALNKARELMAAYDIKEEELGQVEPEVAVIWKATSNDPYQIRKWLGTPVAKFTHCKMWTGGKQYSVAFCGLESDVIFATWLLDKLADFVLRELKTFQQARKDQHLACPRIMGVSFVAGCCARIRERLISLSPIENEIRPDGTANALVVSRNALIESCMFRAGIHLRNVTRHRPSMNMTGYSAGQRSGNDARFDKPVSHGGSLLLK